MNQRSLLFVLITLSMGACMPPSWGASGLLHPGKTFAVDRAGRPHETLWFSGMGVRLKGWKFNTTEPRRGTIVYLHGVADNRGSSASIAEHFVPRGFDVVAYDSRAHGEPEGEARTYGYYEKADLGKVLDQLAEPGPIVLLGTSLGAAVALQAASEDKRVAAVISVATFSDLRTVASERAPFFACTANIESDLQLAEQLAKFKVNEVSPLLAAAKLRIPVLVIHGEDDKETTPSHSIRVHAALAGPKELILVPNAGHNNSINAISWDALSLRPIFGGVGVTEERP